MLADTFTDSHGERKPAVDEQTNRAITKELRVSWLRTAADAKRLSTVDVWNRHDVYNELHDLAHETPGSLGCLVKFSSERTAGN